MEKELDPKIIKATQTSLGKYVKRPSLSEKLLKKPPFRFLHDVITAVMKTTGFFEGLFEEDELISENVKDRDSKILFLNKVISVVGFATGKTLSAKPSKIVAGQEADKTNELLQCLAQALDNKLSSEEAVKKYKEGVNNKSQEEDKKCKEPVKVAKRTNDVNKLHSKSSEKLTIQKKNSIESTTTNEKNKGSVNKSRQRDSSVSKKESQPIKSSSKPSQSKTTVKKTLSDKKNLQDDKNAILQDKLNTSYNNVTSNEIKTSDEKNDEGSRIPNTMENSLEKTLIAQISNTIEQDIRDKLNISSTTADTELNSSTSSRELAELEHNDVNRIPSAKKYTNLEAQNVDRQERDSGADSLNRKELEENIRPSGLDDSSNNNDASEKLSTPTENNSADNTNVIVPIETDKSEQTTNIIRPFSVRPSSSRPGAPRFRDKHDNIITDMDNIPVAKVNVITENTPIEEEEDSSIIIIEESDALSKPKEQQELELSSNQQSHLVQQILDSQKEFSQIAGKTEIEWQFGAQKTRETMNKEVEDLRFNIQALSRVANPLGKLLDHIQEDVEVMRQELQQWTTTYEEASKELNKQKTANEDSLHPFRVKLKQLNADIEEKQDKINDLKIVIHKNSVRIEKLLTKGNVQ